MKRGEPEVRPLIGVSTSEVRLGGSVKPTHQGDPPQREMALGLPYLKAIEAVGGLPVVMPPMKLAAVEPQLDRLSGICLSGGPDLDPSSYGARAHPELGPVAKELDDFELAVAAAADARGIPILAICRGAQALNIARGGTLEQHLPDRVDSIDHRQEEPGTRTTHAVRINPDSKLAALMGERRIQVNSFHHQAVDKLGAGLVAVAWAPDEVVEGLEDPERDFLIGVQWHAETLTELPEEDRLFSGLVDAARRYELAQAGSGVTA
jgi:putative glutamine amidotransferase